MIRSSAVYRVSTLANVIVGNASANTIMAGRASIRLENGVFTKVGAAGALSAGAFFVGVAAAAATDRIVYDGGTGALFYDAGGSGAKVKFASSASG